MSQHYVPILKCIHIYTFIYTNIIVYRYADIIDNVYVQKVKGMPVFHMIGQVYTYTYTYIQVCVCMIYMYLRMYKCMYMIYTYE
jgi:hypothetical protein